MLLFEGDNIQSLTIPRDPVSRLYLLHTRQSHSDHVISCKQQWQEANSGRTNTIGGVIQADAGILSSELNSYRQQAVEPVAYFCPSLATHLFFSIAQPATTLTARAQQASRDDLPPFRLLYCLATHTIAASLPAGQSRMAVSASALFSHLGDVSTEPSCRQPLTPRLGRASRRR